MTETSAASRQQPYLILKPEKGWISLNLSEIWEFRYLLLALATRDLKLRYRQTLLGVAWVLFQPLIAAGVFTFAFGIVAALPDGGTPYFLFAYTGLLIWNVFGNIINRSSQSLVGNSPLISKVYFPRIILPLSTVFSVLVDFAVGLGLQAVLMLIAHVKPNVWIFLMPFWLLLIVLAGTGIGLAAAALNVAYRDVHHILPVLTQFLLFSSPVAYSLDRIPPRFRVLAHLNPLFGPIEAFRWSLIGGGPLRPKIIIYSTVACILIFLAGVSIFRRMERRLADVI